MTKDDATWSDMVNARCLCTSSHLKEVFESEMSNELHVILSLYHRLKATLVSYT